MESEYEYDFYNNCCSLTKELVMIPSINGTKGEQDIAKFIIEKIGNYPYFKEHSQNLFIQELDDLAGRKNIFALVKGTNTSTKTVIIHGHTDTVDIDNYDEYQNDAFDCDSLLKRMSQGCFDKEFDRDISSGHYMVGRGCCDMKSGIALGMEMIHFFSLNPQKLKGNLLFIANPGEEFLHDGIIACVDVLNKWKNERKLDYQAAISLDCSNPHYVGDQSHYMYYGAVGKVLPCFLIVGKETHIGQCFDGIDATGIASRLIDKIHLNMEYADKYGSEISLPPSVLHFEDSKKHYSVNTAKWAYIYFNFLLLHKSTEDLLMELKTNTQNIVQDYIEEINKSYEKYCLNQNRVCQYPELSISVMLYEELYKIAYKKTGNKLENELNEYISNEKSLGKDYRDIGRNIVQKLLDICKIQESVIVIFLAPPYMPYNTLRADYDKERIIADKLDQIREEFLERTGKEIKKLYFYPSLSDSSYLKIDDNITSVEMVEKNLAGYGNSYNLPLKTMKLLQIPALNMGCYGKDPHRNTERLDTDYSFHVLPELLRHTILKLNE